ncbi:MAG: UDP-2,3-diacylglucosamine diphosphatase [Pseudomonadota bacterium]
MQNSKHHATIILSDIHLGKDVCRADMLLEFLSYNTCDTLILNGDILDGWAIRRRGAHQLPELQKRVLDLLNARIAAGTRVVMLPGNHDAELRRADILDHSHFGMLFTDTYVHTDSKGCRFVVLHGDQFDPPLLQDKRAGILSHIGDTVYDGLIALNVLINKVTYDIFGWRVHLSAYLKHKSKKLIRYMGGFAHKVDQIAHTHNVTGMFCGHIHYAEWAQYRGITYGNSGDWVEGCTALCEDADGAWQIVRWFKDRKHYGLSGLATIPDVLGEQDYRDVTEAQLKKINALWPYTGE